MFPNFVAPIIDWDRNLSLISQSCSAELQAQRIFIDGLKKSGTEMFVDLNCAPNYFFRQRIYIL